MDGDEFLAREIVRYGAYVCVRRSKGRDARAVAAAAVPALAERLGLQNEFGHGAAPPRDSIAFLRRHAATPGDIADDDVLEADWIVHVASNNVRRHHESRAGAHARPRGSSRTRRGPSRWPTAGTCGRGDATAK